MTESERAHVTKKFREIKDWIKERDGFLDDGGLKSCYVIASTAEGAAMFHDEEEFAVICAKFAKVKAEEMDERERREGRDG